MRIRPDLLDCAAFLCRPELTNLGTITNQPYASAFIVHTPDDSEPTLRWAYAITARHCIEEIPSQQIVLRVNRVDVFASWFILRRFRD
jgi:hypothetical protein